jgi:hypothetical protein
MKMLDTYSVKCNNCSWHEDRIETHKRAEVLADVHESKNIRKVHDTYIVREAN